MQTKATPSDRQPDIGYRRIFDRLFEQGRTAVLAQTHVQDVPPADGGRWGMSVVFTIDPQSGERLHEITRQARAVAGAQHWPTGARDSAHITVRAIELHRKNIPDDDPLVGRCTAALHRTIAQLQHPVALRLTGLTLTPSGVMACAYPKTSAADSFSTRLRTELGADGAFEDQYDRNIWYISLIHFAGPLADPQNLIKWVHARRDLTIADVLVDTARLATFDHDEHRPILVARSSVPMPGSALRLETVETQQPPGHEVSAVAQDLRQGRY